MKFESFGSAMAGFFGVAGGWLAQYGSNWEVVVVALLGVTLALLEGDGLRLKPAVAVAVFNLLIGVLGGPMVAHWLREHFEIQYPALTLIIAFLAAYVAHDAFSRFRGPLIHLVRRLMGAGS
ncbi:hypothetical protein [Leisingera sp. ANG-M6]|uniref:hypothetical protein n=1 Tax=Leisingera sp. ANG-M6 TaxID=1577900 RepID=UPI00057F8E5A|nr:hypothetical protein [Leisingera sp. ANG-M6]KIC30049.1 hypothetical protein RA24_03650 [Leisingera sp. ANG-M6]